MRLALAAVVLVVAGTGPGWALETPPISTGLDSGWWVVVGSGPEPNGDRPSTASAVKAAAARCGYEAFNDYSFKFSGFRPGFEVFVVGAFASEAEAGRRLADLRRCVPSAYLKRGTYLGE